MSANEPFAVIGVSIYHCPMPITKLLFTTIIFAAAFFTEATHACSVRTSPFDPIDFKSGVIIEGVIQSSSLKGRTATVTVDVERIVEGRFDHETYTFSFFVADHRGGCLPASTQMLPNGQRLVVYLERRDAGLWRKGWMHYEDARAQDYRVRITSVRDR